MKIKPYITFIFLLIISASVYSQSILESQSKSLNHNSYRIRGFTRAGLFLNNLDDNPLISTAFSDFALQLTAENNASYKAYADIRFRYGMEFGDHASNVSIKEAYISWYKRWLAISAGRQIVKWSRSDFFPVQNRMNSRNDLFRTFDDSDRDLGNILVKLNIYLLQNFSFELLYLPFVEPSVLSTEIMDIPDFIKIDKSTELKSGDYNGSWAINMGLRLRNLDIGLSYYLGLNPMPMIYFDSLNVFQVSEDPPAELLLNSELFNISMLSLNFELARGKVIYRGELSYINTERSSPLSDYIPFSELLWTVGIEPSLGNLRLAMEYHGKYIPGFREAESDPVFPEEIVIPTGVPLMLIQDMFTQNISSFNRLYNYQLNRRNHSFGIHISYDNGISVVKPEMNIIYNITTKDMMLSPVIRFRPADNLTVILGSDIFKGRDNSLYDLLSPSLTSIYTGIKVNF